MQWYENVSGICGVRVGGSGIMLGWQTEWQIVPDVVYGRLNGQADRQKTGPIFYPWYRIENMIRHNGQLDSDMATQPFFSLIFQ